MHNNYKILMICPQFKPMLGGYERAAERLSLELVRTGHAVDIITERRDNAWPKRESLGLANILRLWCVYRPGLHRPTSLLSFFLFLLFNGRRYQVFHIHQYGYHAALAIFFGKLFGRPVVLKLTSTNDQGLLKSISGSNRIGRALLSYLHRRVDACITTSEEARGEALAFGIDAQRVALIGNGVSIDEFSPCSLVEKSLKKKQLNIDAELLVLYVGRLSQEKNPLGLLTAWASIKDEFPNTRLIYVGDGPEYELLKGRVAELLCTNSVILAGNRTDVSNWYKIADIHVLPSWHEGLSNTLLEAMSCQLPIVSTRVSGSTDIFKKADIGELIDIGDVDGMAGGIRRLLLDANRRAACGKAARKIIEENYSVESVAHATSAVYDKLLGQ